MSTYNFILSNLYYITYYYDEINIQNRDKRTFKKNIYLIGIIIAFVLYSLYSKLMNS